MSQVEHTIKVSLREATTKGKRNILRKTGLIPAVVYGGKVSKAIAVDLKNLPKKHTKSTLVELDFGTEKTLAFMKEVQVDPLNNAPIHIDFHEVKPEQVVKIRVPLEFSGLTREQEKEGLFKSLKRSVEAKAKAKDVPSSLKIDVSGLKAEESLHASDIDVPAGVVLRVSKGLAIASLIKT